MSRPKAFLHAGGPVRNLAIVKFQKEMIGLAQAAWKRFNEKELNMHTMTLSMSEELSKTIEIEIDAFKQKIIELVAAEKKDAERVYQMNINYFPVSIKIQGGKA